MNGAANWAKAEYTYDEKNRRLTERYYDADGNNVLNGGNYWGIDRAYDDVGNVIRETYYDASGNIGPNRSGIVIVDKTYDEARHLTGQRYLDAAGAPMTVGGTYQLIQDYDENGNMVRETNLDADGNRMLNAAGWAQHDISYDEHKWRVAERFYNVEGAPALVNSGSTGIF